LRQSVIIDGRLVGYRFGGIANYARQLATRLPALSGTLDIRLASRSDTKTLSDRTMRVLTPPHHWAERWAFGAEILARQPDLLHSVDYVQPFVPGVRTVVTVHDLAFLTNPELVTQDSFRYYSQILGRITDADRVIAVSDWTGQQLLSRTEVDPRKVHVIANGYDFYIFRPDGDRDHVRLSRIHPEFSQLLQSERPIVLMVGTIEPRKRHSVILDAFSTHYNSICSLAGVEPVLIVSGQPGWLADETVRKLRELQRQGNTIWLRDVSDRELASLYRASTLLVMPSEDEGFGLPVLEAMASGTTCLVANVGALPELLGETGFFEDTAVPERWAEKIGRILSDYEIRNWRVRRAIERAAGFTWDECARQTVKIYREVLDD
jgi:glycosyltransferase involved in cell wall biosynthesis